jgi:membrane-bound ClpP family serine protease
LDEQKEKHKDLTAKDLRPKMTNASFYAILILVILFTFSLGALTLIAYNSRRRKARTNDRPLVGSRAVVDKQLSPEGTVLVRGDLWNACSPHGRLITSKTNVTVIGLRGHVLVVDDLRN